MSKLDRFIDNKFVQNIVVWIFIMLILAMSIQAENRLLTAVFAVLFLIFPVYINNLKIVPLFNRKNKLLGILLFCLNAFVFSSIAVYFMSNYFEKFEWRMLYNLFSVMILALLFSTAIKIAKDSFIRRQEIKDAELKLLKAQLNPHFLFNTLNNLYGLSVVNSNKLPDLMLKLSDLLRYSLYDTKEQLVPLQKEIQYLQNYISLERIRLEDKTNIVLNVPSDTGALYIAPMLLIVFVENAFKHLGVSKKDENRVVIDLQLNERELMFICKNTIDTSENLESDLEQGKSGIGLENAKKRLNLIYQDRYILDINEGEEEYNVQLTLQL
ncbi:sensor histidine kinase [Aquimarina algiphila]|uniref:sensor histidine kinase n=1 Tax=Aquimarina algiphila TaxID=2047982 RepID=UPI00232F8FA2|nr:histidine kinase [Aquimarina algiphila]